jgi:hypothetical protein
MRVGGPDSESVYIIFLIRLAIAGMRCMKVRGADVCGMLIDKPCNSESK